MSADGGTSQPEVEQKPNLLVPRLAEAVARAQTAVDTVSSGGRNPLYGPATTISGGAWESPDADDFVTDLDGRGTTIKNAFVDAHSFLAGIREPATVEVPGPQAWKADARGLAVSERLR